jgi:hypothetical protein
LWQEHKSCKYDGKWSRSDEKPEHRVVSLSGSDGAEKQDGQSEGKGAHVVPGFLMRVGHSSMKRGVGQFHTTRWTLVMVSANDQSRRAGSAPAMRQSPPKDDSSNESRF